MSAQFNQFNLTPAQILSYLTDIEEKIDREYKIYIPSVEKVDFVSEELLNYECQRMLEFVGLTGCKAEAHFAVLKENVVGQTATGYSTNGVVTILVSESAKYAWKVVLATLAHEIAHHVIYINGIRPDPLNMTNILETYTDLASIYIGFGQQILDEAESLGNRNNGYLTPRTFQLACHIVAVVCGEINSTYTGLANIDPLLDEAIELWESDIDKTTLIKKMMLRFAEPTAEVWRDITALDNILEHHREEIKTRVEKLNHDFFVQTGAKDGFVRRRVAAFNSIYNHNLYDIKPNEEFDLALYGIFSGEKRKKGRVIFDYDVVCPVCGKHYKRRHSDNDTVAVKCSDCGTVFATKTVDWNPTKIQRRYREQCEEKYKKQLLELKQSLSTKLEAEYQRQQSDFRAKAQHELDEKRAELQKQKREIDKRENELLHREKMVANREKEIVEKYIGHLPQLLKWIVQKNIKQLNNQ